MSPVAAARAASALTPADILGLVKACPNLTVLALTECALNDALLRGIAASPCAAHLRALSVGSLW